METGDGHRRWRQNWRKEVETEVEKGGEDRRWKQKWGKEMDTGAGDRRWRLEVETGGGDTHATLQSVLTTPLIMCGARRAIKTISLGHQHSVAGQIDAKKFT